jgi:CysZ protein
MPTIAGGVGHLARGFGMWRRRPGLMLLGMVPALIVFLLLVAAFLVLLWKVDDLVDWATPFADDWSSTARTILRVGLMLAVLAAAIYLAAVTFVGLTLAVGDPFYERIWRETEAMLGGPVPDRGPGFWRSAGQSLGFAGVSMLFGAGVLVVGFLPIAGPMLGAVLGLVVSGRLLASELLARPLDARGLDRAARRDLLQAHRGGVLGFGVATQALFLIPLAAIVAMPVAVVGATTLARELLDPAVEVRGASATTLETPGH